MPLTAKDLVEQAFSGTGWVVLQTLAPDYDDVTRIVLGIDSLALHAARLPMRPRSFQATLEDARRREALRRPKLTGPYRWRYR